VTSSLSLILNNNQLLTISHWQSVTYSQQYGWKKSKENVYISSIDTVTTDDIHSSQHIAQNILLIWVDGNIDESKQDCQNILAQLRNVVNYIRIFSQRDEAIDFLTEILEMNAFLIVEGTIGQHIIRLSMKWWDLIIDSTKWNYID